MNRKLLLLLALSLLLPSSPASSGPTPAPLFWVERDRSLPGEVVEIRLRNGWIERGIRMEDWHIVDARTGEVKSTYFWSETDREVPLGEERVWLWEQNTSSCYGECQNVHWGDPAPPGRYRVEVSTNIGDLRATFDIGQYFTVGFEHRPELEFTVFSNEAETIDQMRAEAEAEDKTIIVSGIVRKKKGYNRPWSYTMGPSSIVLGEVFVEVCDGDPTYVERHRRQWLGERWCPWSSYVKREGR